MALLGGYVRTNTGRPLEGVQVSDGREVRVTGADGGFELRGDGARFVFVTLPTGFACGDWFRRVVGARTSYDDFVVGPEDPFRADDGESRSLRTSPPS